MSAQVEMVLNMLKPVVASLTVSEKSELLAVLTDLLEVTSSDSSTNGQSQSNTVRGINMSGGSNALNFSPVQNQGRGDIDIAPNITQISVQNLEAKEAMEALAHLKQEIRQNAELNPLVKDGAKMQVEQLEEELKKPEPDKGLVQHIIATLKKGLEGVLTLAEPTMKVASLVAKAWGIPVP